jgi:hypothetical protein
MPTREVRDVVADSGARVVVASVDKGLPALDLVRSSDPGASNPERFG